MAYDLNLEPWRTARAVMAMGSDDPVRDMMFIYQWLDRAGRTTDADAVVVILNAVLALGPSRDPKATVH